MTISTLTARFNLPAQTRAREAVLLASPPDEPLAIVPSGDGDHIILTVGHDSIGQHPRQLFALDADGQHLKPLTCGRRVDESPAVSPDGKRIAYVEHEAHSAFSNLHVMDLDGTNDVHVTTNNGGYW